MFKQRCFRLLLLASAIATSLSAAAYSFESAGIYYNITGDNTVEVTYSDRNNNTYSGSISIPETVTNNGTEYSVTTIGESAFKGSAVTSVSMPEGITIIGFEAFSGCQNLESVALPESLTTLGIRTFGGCQSLKTIKIPSGVRAIPSSCFNGCSSLESVTIPEGVTSIEGSAFWSCNLNALTLPESLETIGSYAFCNNCVLKSVNIPAKVKTIESDAFYNCGLTELVIPEEVQTIDNYAFCNNPLKKLTLPSTITSIGSGAFLNNYSLQSITCNATTPPSLGENAFNHNISTTVKVPLSSIAAYRQAEGWKNFTNYYGGEVIADGITYRIDENDAMVAAAEATLTEANIPSSVEFEGNQYPVIKINDEVFSGNTNLTSVTLPESLTTLGDRAFYTCKSLKTIKIPSGVTAIPDYCFNHCLSLESVTIPEGVTTIGDGAFVGCNLKELTLPSTVTMIEIGAFLSNNRCQSITCNATTPPNLGENVFGYNASTTVKVPLQSIAAYRQAEGWKGFANYYGGEMIADGITYRIDDNGAMVAVAEATLTEANIPSSVEFEGNQYPVIKINDRVFSGNTNLMSVTLPESLTTLGDRAFYTCKSLKTIKIPSGVTAIPGHCFDGCSSLESVTIPEGVMTIGDVAFYACSINALTLPESLEKIGIGAFCNNCVLKSVNIPAKVKTIGAWAFSVCGLTDLVIPEGVQTIGNEAFLYNNNLQSITCNAATPPTLGDNAFDNDITPSIKVPLQSIVAYRQAEGWKNFTNYYGGEVVADGITYRIDDNEAMVAAAEATLTEANIPSSVEFEGNQYPVIKINDEVFSGNTNLTTVTLPEGLVEIGVSAFKECKNLESVTLPESLTTLGGEAFRGNTNLTTVTLPAGLVGIGVYAFYGCKNLESVTLPESLTTLGSRSFESCQSLKTIKIPSGVTAIPDHCFEGCSSLESVTIPEGVTTIGSYAFQSCKLNALTLPESLEEIGSAAFNGNRSLKSVNIPAKVKTIESYAFASCSLTDLVIQEGVQVIEEYTFINNLLKNLTLPSTITSIGKSVFYDNYYLQLIICNAATPPTLGDNAFDSDIKPDVKVPISSIAAYKQANGWKDFSNYYGGDVVNNGITYRIDENGATITAAEATIAEANIPSAVEFEGNQHPVKKINDNVFSGNTNLTAVTLPEGLVEIGASAFKGCQNLASVTLPESLTTVGNYAFNDCI